MSSDLYRVSVESVADRTLRGRIYLESGDCGYIPQETVFPLLLLVDAWWALCGGHLYDDDYGDRYPLTEEQGRNIATTMRLREEFADLAEPVFGRKVPVTRDGYLLADDGKTVLGQKYKAEEVFSSYDSYYIETYGGTEDFRRRTDEIVTGYDVGPYHNVPLLAEIIAANPDQSSKELYGVGRRYDNLWEFQADKDDEDCPCTENPCAEIKVTVSDAVYLEHMIAGMCWGTTMSEVEV